MLKQLSSLPSAAAARLGTMWREFWPAANRLTGETGARLASDKAMERMYRTMWLDTDRRAMVHTIRDMDRRDGRVKAIHRKLAGDCIRGGLVLQVNEQASSETLKREWSALKGRMQLDVAEKLRSDARGFVMEGNLPLQLVLNERLDVVAGIRMPSDTIVPLTDSGGRFVNPAKAWEQRDVMTGTPLASWAAYQMAFARLDPDNFDDLGSMGRPFLDACATVWKKLMMTEEDLVIRRRQRAPLRLAHVLEGAQKDELEAYRLTVEGEKHQISTDFYLNRKGGVQAVQGDATLGDIGDVAHLLDSFYAGSPAPKGLFGYTDGMARDILEDLKRSYYDEVDSLQDAMAAAYAMAFRIHLLFKGIDPGPDEFTLRYAQRRTETPNQVADLALKYMALGLPDDMVFSDMGLDADYVRSKRIEQAERNDPYPFAFSQIDEAQVLCVRTSHVMAHMSSTPTLREFWDGLPVKSDRVYKKMLAEADVLMVDGNDQPLAVERVVGSTRVSNMVALSLSALEQYGLHAVVPKGPTETMEPDDGFGNGGGKPW